MSTIVDVARRANVSKTTVSRVINGQDIVRPETRDRVLAAIEALDYRLNYVARGMRTNSTASIGILVPDYANPFYTEMFRGIETVAREAGYISMVCNTDAEAGRELSYVTELLNRRIDGIIFCTYSGDKRVIQRLVSIQEETPVVFMDPVCESSTCVLTDGYTASRDATNYLLSQGRTRIGYIRGPARYVVTHERFAGYRDALQHAGREPLKELVSEGDFSIGGGALAAREILASAPDAIMAATDLMAIGALKEMRSRGIEVPGAVALVGFDDIALASLVDPPLTTIEQPTRELGRQAAEILIACARSGEIMKPTRVIMPGRLIIRQTT
jgi:LacI family transcriptional regulator